MSSDIREIWRTSEDVLVELEGIPVVPGAPAFALVAGPMADRRAPEGSNRGSNRLC